MSLNHLNLTDFDEDSLKSLVSNEVAESKSVEYKLNFQISTDEQKREFLSDLTAMANTDGGDIVFGIREKDGVAAEVIGLKNFDPDRTIGQIENLLRDAVQPRLTGHRIHPVALSNGNFAVVIRAPRSFASPHMVFHKGVTRFCGRNSNGKYDLDVNEIRSAFIASETMSDRLKNFRLDRINRLVSGAFPCSLVNPHLMVFHVLPVISVRPEIKFSTSELQNNIDLAWLKPIGSSFSGSSFNFDGLLALGTAQDEAYLGYVQLFRNGFFEAVGISAFPSNDGGSRTIPGGWETAVVDSLVGCMKAMDALDLEGPYVASLSFLNVRGFTMFRGSRMGAGSPVDRDHLLTDEILIEDTTQAPEKLLRPLFDQIWNGCGWPGSLNYDKNGEWREHR